jgi:homoserine O-acetyltransferase
MARAMRQVRHSSIYLIPASSETRGHGTTGMAKFWKQQLARFLASTPRGGE